MSVKKTIEAISRVSPMDSVVSGGVNPYRLTDEQLEMARQYQKTYSMRLIDTPKDRASERVPRVPR